MLCWRLSLWVSYVDAGITRSHISPTSTNNIRTKKKVLLKIWKRRGIKSKRAFYLRFGFGLGRADLRIGGRRGRGECGITYMNDGMKVFLECSPYEGGGGGGVGTPEPQPNRNTRRLPISDTFHLELSLTSNFDNVMTASTPFRPPMEKINK